MKKIFIKFLFILICFVSAACRTDAIQFDVLALPADLYSVCDNYFCHPEPSEIATNYVIQNLKTHNTINIPYLPEVRA